MKARCKSKVGEKQVKCRKRRKFTYLILKQKVGEKMMKLATLHTYMSKQKVSEKQVKGK